jgi:hypothetical protein
MESMSKHAGTKVIFFDKSTEVKGDMKNEILSALEAHKAQ